MKIYLLVFAAHGLMGNILALDSLEKNFPAASTSSCGKSFGEKVSPISLVEASAESEEKTVASRPRNYSINLIWINRTLDTTEPHLHVDDHIFEWATKNPECVVNLWFDSTLTHEAAITATRGIFRKHKEDNPASACIFLRDVREILTVQKHERIFSQIIPVYFRVDLIRILATIHSLKNNESDYFIAADMDMDPLNEDELFDAQTTNYLEKYGIVVAESGYCEFENGFHIVSNNKPTLFEAMEYVLIQLNIARADAAKTGELINKNGRRADPSTELKWLLQPLLHIVYDSYKGMFYYFYHLEGYLSIHTRNDYDAEFNLIVDRTSPLFTTTLDNADDYFGGSKKYPKNPAELSFVKYNKKFNAEKWLGFPTKKVPLPMTKLGNSIEY